MSMNDDVTILCYGQLRQMKRGDAINFFTEGILASDGSERDRYCSIVTGLKQGHFGVDDLWDWVNQGV